MDHSQPTSTLSTSPNKVPVSTIENEDKIVRAITIGKSPEEVFAFWRNFENLALFMKDVSEIVVLNQKESKWRVSIKSGPSVEWIAEINHERSNEYISWKSKEGSAVQTEGAVWFEKAAGNLGTVVSLSMDYTIPGGKLTELVTKFTGEDPDTLVLTNLKRLKQFLETGEIATTEGQPSGREEIKDEKVIH